MVCGSLVQELKPAINSNKNKILVVFIFLNFDIPKLAYITRAYFSPVLNLKGLILTL